MKIYNDEQDRQYKDLGSTFNKIQESNKNLKDIIQQTDTNLEDTSNNLDELDDYNRERAFSQAEAIYDILMDIFYKSDKENIPTTIASDRKAEERINKIASLKSFYLPNRRKAVLKDR